jgi:hypothetical protein
MDPYLNRFTQPDSIVPLASQGTQALDRYAYANNNPVRYNDPTGHKTCDDEFGTCQIKPNIVPRTQWTNRPIGSGGNNEGYYNPASNEGGYAPYTELGPGTSLPGALDTVVIHHEGDSQSYSATDILNQHLDEEGLYDTAYHYIIGRDGIIYEGRSITVRGAHVLQANSGKIGILILGDFHPGINLFKDDALNLEINFSYDILGRDNLTPTSEQISSATNLIVWLDLEYGINEVVGHRDVQPAQNTVCPGLYIMPFVTLWNSLVQGP